MAKNPPNRKLNRRMRFYSRQKGKCAFCGKFCKKHGIGSEHTLFTLEHIVPLRFGGTAQDNLIGCCRRCNQGRATVIDKAPQHKHKEIFIERYVEKVIMKKRFGAK